MIVWFYFSVSLRKVSNCFSTYFPIADNTHFSGTQLKYVLTEQLVSSKNIHPNGIIFFLKNILIHLLKQENIKWIREQ